MKKAERLLDLITFLLNATQPVSFDEIQNAFSEDYSEGKEDAIARKFERDKADILDLGLPLKFVVGDEDEKGGYIIDRQKYSLPQINLEPEELAVLCLASTAALDLGDSPFTQDLTLALNKIGFAAGDRAQGGFSSLRVCSSDRLGEVVAARRQETLNSIRKAINHHKTVILFYHSLWRDQKNKRKVNPYGLVCRRGSWFLVGFCHLRKDIRVFHVDRISALEVNRFQPKSADFEVPNNFVLSQHVARHPWAMPVHDPVEVVIRFEPPIAETVVSEFGTHVDLVEKDGQARIVYLKVTFLDGLLSTVLWYRHRAKVLLPVELVDKTKNALRQFGGAEK